MGIFRSRHWRHFLAPTTFWWFLIFHGIFFEYRKFIVWRTLDKCLFWEHSNYEAPLLENYFYRILDSPMALAVFELRYFRLKTRIIVSYYYRSAKHNRNLHPVLPAWNRTFIYRLISSGCTEVNKNWTRVHLCTYFHSETKYSTSLVTTFYRQTGNTSSPIFAFS